MFEWNVKNGYKFDEKLKDNPYNYDNIAKVKTLYMENPDEARTTYSEIFYYFDGLCNVKVSQSVHPAGMVISPISLDDNYGTFIKDNDVCLMLDMENIHDFTGLAKYDFLILKTLAVLRDTCRYLGKSYPKTHEINWFDEDVWKSMSKSCATIFQFEGSYAFDCLKKFKPKSIFDMSLVTACIRPTGASYRDELLAHKYHKNPSDMIDELFKDNLGYLVYQEDTIKFLQQICGLSGSEADNVRRAIGRKQKDRLDAAMPKILEGYCNKSELKRDEAEQEAKQFLQVIEDSASYQFGYNHSIAYCLLGYLCAYYRYYHPLEYLTSYLNNAANEDDITNGSVYAKSHGVKITSPKWGVSRSNYFYNKELNTIAKGLASVKFIGEKAAEELYELSTKRKYEYFTDLLDDITSQTSVNTRQIDILIKIDYFTEFGNQRELFRIAEIFYNLLKSGEAKKLSRETLENTFISEILLKNSNGFTKSGAEAKMLTITDMTAILHESEDYIKTLNFQDLNERLKIQNFKDYMGYMGYISEKEEDRPKLFVKSVFPVKRKKTTNSLHITF